MDNKEFESIFDGTVSTARALLVEKAKEYASDVDRMHNFKAAAGALNVTPELALRGMSTKHTISVNDMVKNPDNYTMQQWEEKLGDELNYIILLKALVWERLNENADREEAEEAEPLAPWEMILLDDPNLKWNTSYPFTVTYPYEDGEGKGVDYKLNGFDNLSDASEYHRERTRRNGSWVATETDISDSTVYVRGRYYNYVEAPRHGFTPDMLQYLKENRFTSIGFLKSNGTPVAFRKHFTKDDKIVVRTSADPYNDGLLTPGEIHYHGEEI
jgi:hypothetical protein